MEIPSSNLPQSELEFRVYVFRKLEQHTMMLKELVGNGQPGRIGRNEASIQRLDGEVGKLREEQAEQRGRSLELSALIATIISTAAGLLFKFFFGGHV